MDILNSIKTLLNIKDQDDSQLAVIIDLTTNRLKTLLNVEEVPEQLQYIIVEVSIVRFNRIGSEGVSTHSVEGESMSFNDSDFNGYLDDIKAWKDAEKGIEGVVNFL